MRPAIDSYLDTSFLALYYLPEPTSAHVEAFLGRAVPGTLTPLDGGRVRQPAGARHADGQYASGDRNVRVRYFFA